jgi:hypothetical protein
VPMVPEIIDPVFAKTSQNARFLLSENERFGLVFVKTGPINSGTALFKGDTGDSCTQESWLEGVHIACNWHLAQCTMLRYRGAKFLVPDWGI